MNEHWHDVNTLLRYLQDFDVIDCYLVEQFSKRGNEAPEWLVREVYNKLQKWLNEHERENV